MKNIMNNMNKLALVALSLFLAVGVVSCGCDDDPEPEKDKDKKGKLKLTLSPTEFKKDLGDGTGSLVTQVPDDDFTLTIELTEVDSVDTSKIKLSADKMEKGKHDKTLKDLGVTELQKGTNGTVKLKWHNGLDNHAELINFLSANIPTTVWSTANPTQGLYSVNGKKEIKISGDGIEEAKVELEVELKKTS